MINRAGPVIVDVIRLAIEMEHSNPYQSPHTPKRQANADASRGSMRLLKAVAGWTAVACFIGSTIGTVISMISTFNTIAISGDLVSTTSLSGSMSLQLMLGMALVPIGFVAIIVWLGCRWLMNRKQTD